jgi:hypothetical protein
MNWEDALFVAFIVFAGAVGGLAGAGLGRMFTGA